MDRQPGGAAAGADVQGGPAPEAKDVDDCSAWVHSAGYKVTTTLDWSADRQSPQADIERMGCGRPGQRAATATTRPIVTIEPSTGADDRLRAERDPTYTIGPARRRETSTS